MPMQDQQPAELNNNHQTEDIAEEAREGLIYEEMVSKACVDDDEEGWTPVAHGKGAKRSQNRTNHNQSTTQGVIFEKNRGGKQCMESSQTQDNDYRDGNPLIPLVQ